MMIEAWHADSLAGPMNAMKKAFAENSLRQSLMLSGGGFSIFFLRPISLLFMGAAILAYLTPLFRMVMKKLGYGKVTLNVESL